MSHATDELTGAWDYTTLPETIELGRGVWLERRECFKACQTCHRPGLVIGENTRVYTWCAFNLDPGARLSIGRDCVLTGAVFMCAEQISLGDRVKVSYNVTIADSDFHPLDPQERIQDAIANRPEGDKATRGSIPATTVVIQDDVEIGMAAIILKGVTIGKGARVMPGAVVVRDVAPGTTVAGNPAKPYDPQQSTP